MFDSVRKCLILVLLLTLTSLPVLAQETSGQGRVVSQQDWLDRMPIIIGVVVITILIDVVFIVGFRKREQK
jgi:hypothetical protein